MVWVSPAVQVVLASDRHGRVVGAVGPIFLVDSILGHWSPFRHTPAQHCVRRQPDGEIGGPGGDGTGGPW